MESAAGPQDAVTVKVVEPTTEAAPISCVSLQSASAEVCIKPSSDSECEPLIGWKRDVVEHSLPEAYSSIAVAKPQDSFLRKYLSFAGIGFLISVGYMDPGNWATDIAGGSKFGYQLLSVILFSNILAILLQHLSLKLGVAAERDLAQACRDAYPFPVVIVLWILAEVAIAATDLAEVIGGGVAFYLLFGIPIWAGVLITAGDVLILLAFQTRRFRWFEVFVFVLVVGVIGCFAYEMAIAQPNWADVAWGLVPKGSLFTNPEMLYIAVGILGATVMPHNLYLHSSVIQTRQYTRTTEGKRMAINFGTLDSTLSLCVAFLVNSAILILAAASFYYGDYAGIEIADITTAYTLLSGALGSTAAPIVFGVALLACSQNATLTSTLAGQIVMEGFLQMKIKPWIRRLLTRGLAVIPAAVVAGVMGNEAVGKLLVLSQVILSLQLSFAVIPLVHFTCSFSYVGKYANGLLLKVLSITVAIVIAGINAYLFVTTCMGGFSF